MADPLPDHERVYAAIRRLAEVGELQTGFSVLQGLPTVLEQSAYRVTVTRASPACAWTGGRAEAA